MPFSIETPHSLTSYDIEQAAELTAMGFGREADEHNYQDTKDHLEGVNYLQIVRNNQELVAFASYQRLLWQPGR